MKLALVGDIGGTNARFALWRDEQLESVSVLATADFATAEEAIEHYLAAHQVLPGSLGSVCLACAGPVSDAEFRFTNNHWRINRAEFCQRLQISQLLLINDFSAMALGMTRLADGECLQVCAGESDSSRPFVVIGAGTGLGVGTLLPQAGGGWAALPGEGGHVDLPIGSAREAQLWQVLFKQLGHVRAEDVLSGNGLLVLYGAMCELDNVAPQFTSPAEITTAALAGDATASAVLEQFCCWLGRAAGNNVLSLGARGGVYIVGGIVPRFAEFFCESGFAQSFSDKGCMSDYFAGIPVWLVTAEYPGLMGAGVALQQSGDV